MRVVVAPDRFQGSLSAGQAAAAIEAGLRRARPDAEAGRPPGGAGADPGRAAEPVAAAIAVDGRRAFVEMAEASGLERLPGGVPAPLAATTYGTGELLAAALDPGAGEGVLGTGGRAATGGRARTAA